MQDALVIATSTLFSLELRLERAMVAVLEMEDALFSRDEQFSPGEKDSGSFINKGSLSSKLEKVKEEIDFAARECQIQYGELKGFIQQQHSDAAGKMKSNNNNRGDDNKAVELLQEKRHNGDGEMERKKKELSFLSSSFVIPRLADLCSLVRLLGFAALGHALSKAEGERTRSDIERYLSQFSPDRKKDSAFQCSIRMALLQAKEGMDLLGKCQWEEGNDNSAEKDESHQTQTFLLSDIYDEQNNNNNTSLEEIESLREEIKLQQISLALQTKRFKLALCHDDAIQQAELSALSINNEQNADILHQARRFLERLEDHQADEERKTLVLAADNDVLIAKTDLAASRLSLSPQRHN